MDGFLSALLNLDREVFIFINSRMTTHLFDQVMPIATDLHKQPLFWVSVLLLITVTIFRAPSRKLAAKKWAIGVLILGLSMGLSDLVAYRAVKVWVQRDRPEAAGVPVVLRTNSHSGWSFPSNHAANNFALARTVQILAPGWAIAAYLFAVLVAFSRIYVGVHYPLDAAGGALIGFTCASFVSWLVAYATTRFKSGGYFSRARKTDPSS